MEIATPSRRLTALYYSRTIEAEPLRQDSEASAFVEGGGRNFRTFTYQTLVQEMCDKGLLPTPEQSYLDDSKSSLEYLYIQLDEPDPRIKGIDKGLWEGVLLTSDQMIGHKLLRKIGDIYYARQKERTIESWGKELGAYLLDRVANDPSSTLNLEAQEKSIERNERNREKQLGVADSDEKDYSIPAEKTKVYINSVFDARANAIKASRFTVSGLNMYQAVAEDLGLELGDNGRPYVKNSENQNDADFALLAWAYVEAQFFSRFGGFYDSNEVNITLSEAEMAEIVGAGYAHAYALSPQGRARLDSIKNDYYDLIRFTPADKRRIEAKYIIPKVVKQKKNKKTKNRKSGAGHE